VYDQSGSRAKQPTDAIGPSTELSPLITRALRHHLRNADHQSLLRDRDRDVLRRPRAAALPPRHADCAAKIRIDTLEAIESSLGRGQLRFVLAWAELHQNELLENWRLARDGETLNEIEPLR
jgi:hypothetical protein